MYTGCIYVDFIQFCKTAILSAFFYPGILKQPFPPNSACWEYRTMSDKTNTLIASSLSNSNLPIANPIEALNVTPENMVPDVGNMADEYKKIIEQIMPAIMGPIKQSFAPIMKQIEGFLPAVSPTPRIIDKVKNSEIIGNYLRQETGKRIGAKLVKLVDTVRDSIQSYLNSDLSKQIRAKIINTINDTITDTIKRHSWYLKLRLFTNLLLKDPNRPDVINKIDTTNQTTQSPNRQRSKDEIALEKRIKDALQKKYERIVGSQKGGATGEAERKCFISQQTSALIENHFANNKTANTIQSEIDEILLLRMESILEAPEFKKDLILNGVEPVVFFLMEKVETELVEYLNQKGHFYTTLNVLLDDEMVQYYIKNTKWFTVGNFLDIIREKHPQKYDKTILNNDDKDKGVLSMSEFYKTIRTHKGSLKELGVLEQLYVSHLSTNKTYRSMKNWLADNKTERTKRNNSLRNKINNKKKRANDKTEAKQYNENKNGGIGPTNIENTVGGGVETGPTDFFLDKIINQIVSEQIDKIKTAMDTIDKKILIDLFFGAVDGFINKIKIFDENMDGDCAIQNKSQIIDCLYQTLGDRFQLHLFFCQNFTIEPNTSNGDVQSSNANNMNSNNTNSNGNGGTTPGGSKIVGGNKEDEEKEGGKFNTDFSKNGNDDIINDQIYEVMIRPIYQTILSPEFETHTRTFFKSIIDEFIGKYANTQNLPTSEDCVIKMIQSPSSYPHRLFSGVEEAKSDIHISTLKTDSPLKHFFVYYFLTKHLYYDIHTSGDAIQIEKQVLRIDDSKTYTKDYSLYNKEHNIDLRKIDNKKIDGKRFREVLNADNGSLLLSRDTASEPITPETKGGGKRTRKYRRSTRRRRRKTRRS